MFRSLILAALFLPASTSPPAGAQEPIACAAEEPSAGLRLTRLHADVLVKGPVMKVRQEFVLQNPGDSPHGFELVFPLGRGASITGLTLEVDARPLEGALLSVEEARKAYRSTLRADGNPALLEHYGEALFRARIQPIPPGQERTLVLSYERMVESEGDLQMLHLPLTAFRRIAGPFAFSIEGELVTEEPVSMIYSPTHAAERGADSASFEGARALHHTYFRVDSPAESCETDFLAYYRPQRGERPFEVTVLSERTSPSEDGTFLALVRGLSKETHEPDGKNVVFVLDRSGSMKEEKIEQARVALRYLVSKLRPEDRFNIVSYSVETSAFAKTLQVPSAESLERANAYIDGLVAEGGTDMEAALRAALDQFTDGSVLGQIVFLTDGLPTNGVVDERKLCAIVRENNPHEVRVIAFGLGFDVNGALLDRLAAQNHGMSEYVLPDQPIEEKVPGFYERMHAPLLLDAGIAITGGEVHDIFPREPGDLYAGHDFMVVGRYGESGPVRLTLSGRRGDAHEEHTFRFELARADGSGSPDFIGRLWAAKKIGYLVDEVRLEAPAPAEPPATEPDPRIAEIVRLGTRYGILTEYTAFLAGEGTDLYAFGENVAKCTAEIEGRAAVVSGAHGVAQACNSKALQRSGQVAKSNTWVGANGQQVSIGGVSCVNGKTFFRRGNSWQDAALVAAEADETIELYSEDFFALLDRNPWLGACVARTGDLLVEVEGRNVRIENPAGS
jgi:Ca-activated chloride channel family protein